jgi:hypothetical protein
MRLGLVTVPSKRAGRLISTLEEALIEPFTDPDIMTMFALISALMTAPSEMIKVSLEKILPFTYPAIRTVPLNERLPSNLHPSSMMAQISFFFAKLPLRWRLFHEIRKYIIKFSFVAKFDGNFSGPILFWLHIKVVASLLL